jgi:hypothetical protein
MLARRLESLRNLTECEEEFEMRHAKTGETRWHRIITTPRRLETGGIVWDGIQIDITDHKRSEEHLRLLLNELNHRVKNTLATVQSLASQSFRLRGDNGARDLPALYAAFEAVSLHSPGATTFSPVRTGKAQASSRSSPRPLHPTAASRRIAAGSGSKGLTSASAPPWP